MDFKLKDRISFIRGTMGRQTGTIIGIHQGNKIRPDYLIKLDEQFDGNHNGYDFKFEQGKQSNKNDCITIRGTNTRTSYWHTLELISCNYNNNTRLFRR